MNEGLVTPCEARRIFVESTTYQLDLLRGIGFSEVHYGQIRVGSHLRHVGDRFYSFESGYPRGFVDYTNREEKLEIEGDFKRALEYVFEGIKRVEKLDFPISDQEIRVVDEYMAFDSSIVAQMNHFCNHSIHHFGSIRVGLELLGFDIGDDNPFGVANSTFRKYQS